MRQYFSRRQWLGTIIPGIFGAWWLGKGERCQAEEHTSCAAAALQKIDLLGYRTTYTYVYDRDGKLMSVYAPTDKVTTYTYEAGRLHTVTESGGRITPFYPPIEPAG